MLARSLRMPVFGRTTAGVASLMLAAPMCRVLALTDDARTARRIGAAVAATDFAGVLAVVTARDASRQRRAAARNAAADVVLAAGLAGLATRRSGSERAAAILASGSVWFGAVAWLMARRQLAARPRLPA